MEKLFKVALASALMLSGAFANDLLSKATNGAADNNSVGVKTLNSLDLEQVNGGYSIKIYNLSKTQNFSQAVALVNFSQYERDKKVSCGLNMPDGCSGYYATSNFQEVMSQVNYSNGEYLGVVATKINKPYGFGSIPQYSYSVAAFKNVNGQPMRLKTITNKPYIANELINSKAVRNQLTMSLGF
ncbi:hypothetical protein [Campylobacter concisus]|uniref:hypothetical protein n=1 Tax=Campylobacter concisus TaxID=199 RepID=UPI000CD9B84D|nr:hypothetical protein [Campylobacter concisus]